MGELREVKVPDIGNFDAVDVVEVLVQPGAHVEPEQSLITIESEKASMEVPSPVAGTVREVRVNVGDKVGEGAVIVTVETGASGAAPTPAAATPLNPAKSEPRPQAQGPETPSELQPDTPPPPATHDEPAPTRSIRSPAVAPTADAPTDDDAHTGTDVAANDRRSPPHVPLTPAPESAPAHASPSVRQLARELGVDLGRVAASGPKGRVLRDDVQGFVRSALSGDSPGIPEIPAVDFARFGEVEMQPLSRINRLTARNVQRSWLNVPMVTHFDEADITDIEDFRRHHAQDADRHGFKLTFVSFILKACAATLHAFPRFNSSLAPGGEQLVVKKYIHLGVAVDTEDGLVVPVLRDVDRKGVLELARELADLSERARAGKLTATDIQGASFSISSLGGIGGTNFTPIVNAPEVAILGVARAQQKPVYVEGSLQPRLMLPLALTYDHRVIDGASAARFLVHLKQLLTDFRLVVL